MLTKGRTFLLAAGAIAGAILALSAGTDMLWKLQPFALAQDVDALRAEQLDTAIEVYEQKELDLILKGGSVQRDGMNEFNRTQQFLIDKELNRTRSKLEALREKKIEEAR